MEVSMPLPHARLFGSLVASVALLLALATPVDANHSWNGYHWARTANPFTVALGDNLTTPDWKSHLGQTASDWSTSNVLDAAVAAGGSPRRNCRPNAGRVEVCNASYGNNGWLGVATIWVSGLHITQGTVKLNDYYLQSSTYAYANSAEREHVICQEVGHTFGLDHQSTDGSSLNTCMDYYHNTSDSDTKSTTPNQHDYDELGIIYQHLDSTSTLGGAPARGAVAVSGFSEDGTPNGAARERGNWYVQHLGGGDFVWVHVYWASR
jgi:hypothetical protein